MKQKKTKSPSEPEKKELLVSKREVHRAENKLKSLDRLLKNPRKDLPELKFFIYSLTGLLKKLIRHKNVDFDEKARAKVDKDIEVQKMIEELLIRVIIREEVINDVIRELELRYRITLSVPIFYV